MTASMYETLLKPAVQGTTIASGDQEELNSAVSNVVRAVDSVTSTHRQNVQDLEKRGIVRSDPSSNAASDHLNDIGVTVSIWGANAIDIGGSLVDNIMNLGGTVTQILTDADSREEALENIQNGFDFIKEKTPEAWDAIKSTIDSAIKNSGVDPEMLSKIEWVEAATFTLKALTAPTRFMLDLGSEYVALAKAGELTPDNMLEAANKVRKEHAAELQEGLENVGRVLKAAGQLAGSAFTIGKNLVQSIADDYGFDQVVAGFNQIKDGILEGDWKKIAGGMTRFGQAALEFAGEFTGAADLGRAYQALREGDFVGFSMGLAFGVAGMVGTVATFGAANAWIAATKTAMKAGAKELAEKGMKELVKDVGADVLEGIVQKVPNFLDLQKEFGEKIAKESRDDIMSALGNPSRLKELNLPENLADMLKNVDNLPAEEALSTEIRDQLDKFIQEEVRKKTHAYSEKLLEEAGEAIEEETRRVVGNHFGALLDMSDEELIGRFDDIIKDMTPEAKAEFLKVVDDASLLPASVRKHIPGSVDDRAARDYASALRNAVQSGKLDDILADAYTDDIVAHITRDMRESFTESWQKNVDEMLDELQVHDSLREDLAKRWNEAGLRGFDEGLEPIRKLVKDTALDEMKKQRKRRRRRGGNRSHRISEAEKNKQNYEFRAGALSENRVDDFKMWRGEQDEGNNLYKSMEEKRLNEVEKARQQTSQAALVQGVNSLESSQRDASTSEDPGNTQNPETTEITPALTLAELKAKEQAKNSQNEEDLPAFMT